MSDFAAPGFAGNDAPGRAGQALSHDEIESILADFRDWLRESATAAPDADVPAQTVDLCTLVAQFTALRQEINLQTRAVRQQQEQNSETLARYDQSLQLLEAALQQHSPDVDERLRPLLGALIDVADTQMLAAREMARVAQGLNALLDAEEQASREPPPEPPQPTLVGRLLGLGRFAKEHHRWFQRLDAPRGDPKLRERIRDVVEAAASGLDMGLQRIERALHQLGIEAIPAVGQPFNPEAMEAVAAVAASGQLPGEVVEEVRRGYRWRDRVFRVAQVKVAR